MIGVCSVFHPWLKSCHPIGVLAVTTTICSLDVHYPKVTEAQRKALAKAREELESE